MATYVTSDTHFNHTNICRGVSRWSDKSGCRDFNTVEEMNETILDGINSVVSKHDTLYHLGDFAFGDKRQIPALRSSINCQDIRFLYGNHDHAIMKHYRDLFTWTRHYHEFRHNHTLVCLFHFPIDAWHKNGRGSVHLFGHCHGNHRNPAGRRIDVGVDCYDFKPLLLEDAIEIAKSKDVVLIDHHGPNTN